MATTRKKAQASKAVLYVLGGLGVAGIGWLVLSPTTSGPAFEQAMLTARRRDGENFSLWLLLYRMGVITRPLRLDDEEYNQQLLSTGIAMLGVTDAELTRDPLALQRAMCSRYKTKKQADELADLPSDWSRSFRTYAEGLLREWEGSCTAFGYNLNLPAPEQP